jgi:GTP-binding protein
LTSSPTESRLFRIAILGRPNVGKSTLFNRLLGRRRAITSPIPGVTRDRVEAVCALRGRKLLLVDTGGFQARATGVMEQLVSQGSLQEASEADLILLVVDVAELTGEDLRFIEELRPHRQKVILVVNKADNPQREQAAWNFLELGFGTVVGVSATHGRGIEELEDRILERAAAGGSASAWPDGEEGTGELALSILGKPNTGKSTLLNALLGEEKALVSEIPGTTRDPVEGRFRRKSKVEESIEYFAVNRAIESIDRTDVAYLLVDAREGLTDQDKKIASLIVRKGKGIILVLNKWDLMADVPNQFQAVKDRIHFVFPVLSFAPLLAVSARTGKGIPALLDTTVKVWRQLNRRVETAELNRALQEWLAAYPVPSRGKNLKIRYATQASVRPVRFVVFVNRLAGFPRGYTQYLANRLRQDLGFSLIPFHVELRESASGRK